MGPPPGGAASRTQACAAANAAWCSHLLAAQKHLVVAVVRRVDVLLRLRLARCSGRTALRRDLL